MIASKASEFNEPIADFGNLEIDWLRETIRKMSLYDQLP
jgi:hypothetical protein